MRWCGTANLDGSTQVFAESRWPRRIGAQCGLERGTSPLHAGTAHRGDGFVSATENCRVNEAARLARDYDPAMPGPA